MFECCSLIVVATQTHTKVAVITQKTQISLREVDVSAADLFAIGQTFCTILILIKFDLVIITEKWTKAMFLIIFELTGLSLM